jgi:hypothetical protein
MNRRDFIQASAASFVLSGIAGFEAHASETEDDETLRAFARTDLERKR